MKRIGIMTLHYSDNYGAVLQAFSLQHFISTLPNCDARIIPYCKEKNKTLVNSSKIERILSEEKKKKLRDFLVNNAKLELEDTDNIMKYVYFDYYVTGSDQVWNTGFEKYDDNYFLNFVPGTYKKISYAASIGMNIKKNDRFQKEIFEKFLPEFDMLSVRESEHVDFITRSSGKECELVLDPTFLIDRSVFETLTSIKTKKEKYILLIWLDHDNTLFRGIDFANLVAIKFGYGVYHNLKDVPDRLIANSLGSIYYDGVEDFLWYVKNADLVITNSFHAMAFSIIFQRPFYTFFVESMRSRIDSLKRILGLEERCIELFLPLEKVNFDVDYVKINHKLEKYRKKSVEFLKRALDIRKDEV